MRRVVEAVRSVAQAEERTHAVIGTDDIGTILYWNRRAEDLYGWRSTETLGRNIVDVTPTQSSQREAEEILQVLMRGQQWSGSFMVRHRDGTPMIVHVRDIPVLDAGSVVGVVGISYPL